MEALEWLVRLRDDKVSAEDRAAFQAWLKQDPVHADVWRRAEALWERLDVARPAFQRRPAAQTGTTRRSLLVGALTLSGGLAGFYAYRRFGFTPDFATAAGERRRFDLPDGSAVELGSHSALSFAANETRRGFELHYGEGFFEVAANPLHPFEVIAGNGISRTTEARFNVKYVGGAATVTAAEHALTVAVANRQLSLRPGWQVRYRGESLGKPEPADLGLVEAWRHDRIIFENAPLRNVLTELERYRNGRIVLTDSRLGDIPVTAVFDARQADAALRTIVATLPIRLLIDTEYLTVLAASG